MSPTSLLGRSTYTYADAAALGAHITNNYSLLQGVKVFKENPFEHLYHEVYILRGRHDEPVAHWPVSQVLVSWPWMLLSGIDGQ